MRGDLEPDGTNLLRRGEDEFMVAALEMEYVSRTMWKEEAELHLFRSGEWSVMRPPIRHYGGGNDGECAELMASMWKNHINQLLCWVDLSPELRYVPLLVDSEFVQSSCRNVCVCHHRWQHGQVVNIFPRCCCGDLGFNYCQHSRHAYTVQT
jgi:hypothetical protein